jgi:hypothetical protein
MELVFSVDVALRRPMMASRRCDGVFAICPFVRQAHEVIDGLWLAATELLLEVASEETVLKGVDGSFGRNILRRVAEAGPTRNV